MVSDCFYSPQGWWTYELCPGRHLRQFHVEEGAPLPNPVISLGNYDGQASTVSLAIRLEGYQSRT